MKNPLRNILLPMAVILTSAASCVNAEMAEPETGKTVKELATIDEQVASMEATVADLEALQAAAEGREEEIAGAVSALSDHIADLKAGTPLLEGTLATLAQQKKLAGLIGTIEAGTEPTKAAAVTKAVASIDKGACGWLGKHFASYYPAVKAEAAAKARLASYDFRAQQILVEGVLSDVEAGLRKGIDAKELAALAAGIGANAEQAEELAASLSAVTAEVQEGYTKAVETAVDDHENFDLPALTQLNSSVTKTLAEADNTLAGLIARVEECETQVAELKDRVAALEGEIADLNGLLDMIQSVTFMSEYSTENAIAYYTLGTEAREDGKKVRNASGTVELNYVIRPASAAQALTVSDLWDNEVKVFGYYAQTITKAAPETFDFDITDVTADESGSGIVTVTVSATALDKDFYFKEKGAKLALSITTGKTDLTSKFVEVVPKDASGTVYVETIELSAKSLEIDNGETADIDAYITPDTATEGGVTWTTSNSDILTVTDAGVIEGKSVGTAVITATTKGTDEWGAAIAARCSVKVNPAVKILGADSVAEGGTTEISIQSPSYIDPQYISWEIGTYTSKGTDGVPVGFNTNQSFASIDENGTVTGISLYYNTSNTVKDYVPLAVKCTIAGATPIVLYHDIRVIAVQPLGISISGMSDTDTQVTTKVNQAIGLYGTMKPETVKSDYFKLSYLGANDGYFAASSVGTSTVTVSVQPGGTGQYNYFYPKGKGLSRSITVIVEPYYVQTLSLPATFEMNPNQTATLTPTFTSDGDNGEAPTYRDLIWTSSDPTVISINETTGEMTSLKEGTVTITATTSHDNAVPSGQSQKSATCVVTVKTPVAPIAIGDYFYSDGTWGSDANPSGKTVIGVIFSTANAVASDTKLLVDYPNCSHGLVVALAEYNSAFGQFGYSSVYSWLSDNGHVVPDVSKPNGYGSTLGLTAYGKANSSYVELFGSSGPLAIHNVQVPGGLASAWYIPSYYEMKELYTNKDAVNSSLSAISADQVGTGYYWSSTLRTYNVYNDCQGAPFNMAEGDWYAYDKKSTTYPVRVILAF